VEVLRKGIPYSLQSNHVAFAHLNLLAASRNMPRKEAKMPDILHEVTIAAAPDKVFKALTEGQGLEAWWTPHAAAEPKVGSTVQVSFRDGQFVVKMDVAKLESGRKVEWIIQQGVPDWRGTHVTWDLSPLGKGTKVLFGHRGFASADGSLPGASYNWAFYLTSLVDYLEMGNGNPGGLDKRFHE
jgi:uncharacterized protein YndB with AHSA1/START domain